MSGPHRLSRPDTPLAHISSAVSRPEGDPLVLRIRVAGLQSLECVIGRVGMVEEAAASAQIRLDNSESSASSNGGTRDWQHQPP